MPSSPRTVGVIGAGPAGIAAVKNFADLGFDVTAFDLASGVGGQWRYDDPAAGARGAQGWDVQTHARDTGEDRLWHFDALVVCNGHHGKPRWPSYPGAFAGEYLHAHAFKRAEPFRGRRVLVLGGGNSACDVAVETARVAERVDLSWRRGYWLIPKFLFGHPADAYAARSAWLPSGLRGRLMAAMLHVAQGPNAAIGLQTPDHPVGATHPTVNSELYDAVRHGRVHPRPDLARFDGHRVHFVDGGVGEYNTVIACTGYWIDHPFFDPVTVDFSRGPVPLYLRMLPADLRVVKRGVHKDAVLLGKPHGRELDLAADQGNELVFADPQPVLDAA